MYQQYFRQTLADLRAAGLERSLRVMESAPGARIRMDGRELVLMASNDYLGLANHPHVRRAATAAIDAFGVGAGAARLISGHTPLHAELERHLAAFKGTEAALVFSSGYSANLGLLSCLLPENGLILIDRLSHASLIDGAFLSRRTFRTYPHRDCGRVERLLAARPARQPALIATDGVFSMDGDLAPLPELAHLAERYDALLLVDDAHATGVLGTHGRGSLEHFGLAADRIIQMGTLGKALGGFGAFVAGSRDLVAFLLHRCRPFIFTTALPPAMAAAADAALAIVTQEPQRRRRLADNRVYLANGLRTLGFPVAADPTPIVPLILGEAAAATQFAARLLAAAVFSPAIRPPTVPRGRARVRLSITSEHTRADLDQALAAITQAAAGGAILA